MKKKATIVFLLLLFQLFPLLILVFLRDRQGTEDSLSVCHGRHTVMVEARLSGKIFLSQPC